MKKYIKKIVSNHYIQNLYHIIFLPEMRVLPGTIAYFMVMSVVPAISIVAIICSKFGLSIEDVLTFLGNVIPTEVEELLFPFFTSVNMDSVTIWFVILGFILASNGAHSIILASNTLYKVENQNYIVRRIKAFFLTIILMSLFLFVLVFMAFGNLILKFILNLSIISNFTNEIYQLLVILKWPISIIIIFFLVKVLYTIAPDKKIFSKYVNKGAIFTTIGWVLATSIYSLYVNNWANYDVIYGSLSNIIVLMILIYVISYILVIGIAINANEKMEEIGYKKEKKEHTTM